MGLSELVGPCSVEPEFLPSSSSMGALSVGSTEEASEMTEGMEGLETDMETAEPKSEELETKRVIERAQKILKEVQSIKRLADEQKGDGRGSLSIGTTHTQARYVLPQVIRKFRERYPDVELHLERTLQRA